MSQDMMIWEKTGKAMARIPAGKFLFGEAKQELELPEFWIDRTLVTKIGRRFPQIFADHVREATKSA